MKSIGKILLPLAFLLSSGCSEPEQPDAVAVMIAPVGAIVRAVAGNELAVAVIVPPGKDIHEYEPTPGDLKVLHGNAVYLNMNLPGERKLADSLRLAGAPVCDLAAGIPRLPMDFDEHGESGHMTDAGEFGDPHLWMSPENCALIAEDCARILSGIHPDKAEYFTANAAGYAAEMRKLADRIKEELAPCAGRRFYVFHPAFGYFARDFKLEQRAIEPAGKSPTPRELERVLSDARADRVTCIYASAEFNPALPEAAAKILGCRLLLLDPLPEDPAAGFADIAEKLKIGFESGGL